MKNHFDLVVVGGGALGVFSAYHALQQGKKVALIERNKQPRQATVRNFGQIVPSGLSTDWKKYGKKSLEIYNALQTKSDFTVRQFGSVYLASDQDEINLAHELHAIDQQNDYPSTLLSGKDACSMWTGLKSSYCKEALFYKNEISIDPDRMIYLVISYLIEQFGLVYCPYTIVNEVERNEADSCRIRTNTFLTLSAEHVLICAGAEYQFLFPEIYKNDEITCVKIHMLITQPQSKLRIQGNILSGLSIRRYEAFKECPSYAAITAKNDQDPFIQEAGIHILFKQANNGQVILGDSHHYADAHNREDLGFKLDQAVNNYILEKAKEIFDLESYEIQSTWYGIYSQAKHEGIISKTIEDRIHILNGIGGKGMTASPGYTFHYINKLFGHD